MLEGNDGGEILEGKYCRENVVGECEGDVAGECLRGEDVGKCWR